MTVISRRQKEILLSDVQRMINNNNHTAFANHAKIAERISNGDLMFYIDSPKKEFVIKYGNKEIRFNCNDQQMTELKGIKFDDNSVIKGISDTTTPDSSNIALSTKWGKSHNHDNDYSKKNHNHDSQYAAKNHNHDSQYAPIVHDHPLLASTNHTHSISNVNGLQNALDQKANTNHTHFGIETEKQLIEFIQDHRKTTWDYIFTGLSVVAEVGEGLTLAGLVAEVNALASAVAGSTGINVGTSTTKLGTMLTGLSDKMKGFASFTQGLGDNFESIKGVTDTMAQYINKGSEYVGKAQKWIDGLADKFSSVNELYQRLPDILDAGHTLGGPGIDLATEKLPSAVNLLDMNGNIFLP